MKKKIKIVILNLLIMCPLNVLAYSDYIIPGGDTIGLEIKTSGVIIAGFYKVKDKYNIGIDKIKIGDIITAVNDTKVYGNEDLVKAIDENVKNGNITLNLLRGNKNIEVELELIFDENAYKTGLYVKDNIAGIGTLTYIDPETKIYGSLGHEITDANTGIKIEVSDGDIFKSSITGIDRSTRGIPGGKNASFNSSIIYGDIDKNTDSGIFGTYTSSYEGRNKMKIASLDEVETGPAKIYTVVEGEKIEEFDIKITKINKKSKSKALVFEVVDEDLLNKTGGIVQGMSGSPIIQNDKIIGAVTHVVVSEPNIGYGISIITMLEEGEKE